MARSWKLADQDMPSSPDITTSRTRRRRRILFYSHDGTGLGHLRINLGILAPLAEQRPNDAFVLLTGSSHASAFGLPANVDFVKIPSMPLRDLYADLPAPTSPATGFKDVMYFRETVVSATVVGFGPDLIVVDHAPAGLFKELTRGLNWLTACRPRPKLALMMRDITFGLEQTRNLWKNEDAYTLMDRAYDRILVYGSQEVFDPIQEYGLSSDAAAKTRFCGYLPPPPPIRTRDDVRSQLGTGDRPLIAISVGGGADGADLLRAFLAGYRDHAPDGVHSHVVTGPLLPEPARRELEAIALDLPDLTLSSFDRDYLAVVHAADVVIGMGGYNSVCEAVHAGKRMIVVPRKPGSEEQVIRARRFASLGVTTVIEPDELGPDVLWRAIRDELDNHSSPPAILSFDGAEIIRAELNDLANQTLN